MKAAVLRRAGEIPDFDEPEATEGRELVELVAAGYGATTVTLQDDKDATASALAEAIGATAGAEAAVPAALLRSRRITISGSGAGSASVQSILAAIPEYMQLIADGRLDTAVQEFPLSKIEEAWAAAQFGATRVVVVPD
ncbi:hypothetical protein [Nocardia sp. CA-120079]|uniref:hypothetical protein n=1 Tax=Nocardia sp. CA-120079 TaxID=3239974 RepID=UPI003D9A03D5